MELFGIIVVWLTVALVVLGTLLLFVVSLFAPNPDHGKGGTSTALDNVSSKRRSS
ncbi:hypothetical protein OED52_00810 [Rhodococcus sp. Z13]|uniref:Uncharacterized protein n=1 Tax=Rhodococcus sacchari TaxID=2962047 RepID=A0ACD4DHJ2_9NOCA|nr:hypothetical protein [Rhodococcus sp. Z13]UYP19168.1 hypothetical protein OED52_00810 [Rhodococcus sp. Z13]